LKNDFMKETITLEIETEDIEGYAGLRPALERAIEKLTESASIKPLAKLLTRLSDAYETIDEQKKKRSEIEQLRDDLKEVNERLQALSE
jgi:hypothetical protein